MHSLIVAVASRRRPSEGHLAPSLLDRFSNVRLLDSDFIPIAIILNENPVPIPVCAPATPAILASDLTATQQAGKIPT